MLKSKRSQLAIFVIIAIILVVGVVLMLVFRERIGLFRSSNQPEIKTYVEDCIAEIGEELSGKRARGHIVFDCWEINPLMDNPGM